ncbi:MAG: fused MFS/spermidine synthase, partial [Acidimicrobiales bacterium]
MIPGTRRVLFAVFAATGFSAVGLQVVWQRVISLHGGADLFSVATVVGAFLAGLGLGNLAGGALADRLGARRSLLAFAVANVAIAVFAWASIWLFYDLYNSLVDRVDTLGEAFAFHFALLVIPTTLMGLSLPLLTRGLARRADEAASLVGRLYSVNTLGAAAGAAVSGWWLLGSLGFTGTVRLAGLVNLGAAGVVLVLWRRTPETGPEPGQAPAPTSEPAGAAATDDGVPEGRVWPWIALYGLTGAVALGLELVFFRIIDAVMRSNSYTFGHVLSLYLVLFGLGTAVGARLVRRAARPDRWFLWLQYGAGVGSAAGVALLVAPLRFGGSGRVTRFMEDYFATDGFSVGGWSLASGHDRAVLAFANVLAPLLVMGAPVLLLGASFPFIQAMVARRLGTLGRRTGTLLFANIVGNVAGILLVGFVVIDRLGTSGTLQLLAGLLLLPGLAAAAGATTAVRRAGLAIGATALLGAALAGVPSNGPLWALVHSTPRAGFELAEDRSCVTAHVDRGGVRFLYINGASQNGYPFDDYHVLIGLTPALMHPAPDRAMAVGLGIGASSYGMAQDGRIDRVDTVEICGGQIELLERLGRDRSFEIRRLLDDPRVRLRVGDGRKYLLGTDDRYDVMTVDTLRPQSAYSGSLYSTEFYELVASRLTGDGLFSQWTPTPRALDTLRRVFPFVQV